MSLFGFKNKKNSKPPPRRPHGPSEIIDLRASAPGVVIDMHTNTISNEGVGIGGFHPKVIEYEYQGDDDLVPVNRKVIDENGVVHDQSQTGGNIGVAGIMQPAEVRQQQQQRQYQAQNAMAPASYNPGMQSPAPGYGGYGAAPGFPPHAPAPNPAYPQCSYNTPQTPAFQQSMPSYPPQHQQPQTHTPQSFTPAYNSAAPVQPQYGASSHGQQNINYGPYTPVTLTPEWEEEQYGR